MVLQKLVVRLLLNTKQNSELAWLGLRVYIFILEAMNTNKHLWNYGLRKRLLHNFSAKVVFVYFCLQTGFESKDYWKGANRGNVSGRLSTARMTSRHRPSSTRRAFSLMILTLKLETWFLEPAIRARYARLVWVGWIIVANDPCCCRFVLRSMPL